MSSDDSQINLFDKFDDYYENIIKDNSNKLVENYDDYLYINLAILYNLVGDPKNKLDKELLEKIKNFMIKHIYDNLCKLNKDKNKYNDVITYIKDTYTNISLDYCKITETTLLPPPQPASAVFFSVKNDVKFNLTKQKSKMYKAVRANISGITIDDTNNNLQAIIDVNNNYYLILKLVDLELHIYQKQENSNLKFKIANLTNNLIFTVCINSENNITIDPNLNDEYKNNKDVLLLILLYVCQFIREFKLTHKNFFQKILSINSKDIIFKYWNSIFNYFGYSNLLEILQKLKDIQEETDKIPDKLKFSISDTKEFSIKPIENDDNLYKVIIDESTFIFEDCSQAVFNLFVKKDNGKFYLQLNNDILVEQYNDNKLLKFIYNHDNHDNHTCNIDANGNITINNLSPNLSNFNNNYNLLILLYAILNNYSIDESNLSDDFKKLENLKETENGIYCYWKKIFKLYDKELDDYLNKINYIPPAPPAIKEFSFDISNTLKFERIYISNNLKLKDNSCNDYVYGFQEGESPILELHDNKLKININHNLYFIIVNNNYDKNFLKFTLHNNNNTTNFFFRTKSNSLTINYNKTGDLDIKNFNNDNKNDILFLILLFIYLNNNNIIKKYYDYFYVLIDDSTHNNWKKIFCSFGINYQEFDNLIDAIRKDKEDTNKEKEKINEDKKKISKEIVTLSDSKLENYNFECNSTNSIIVSAWKVESFKDTNNNKNISLTNIKIFVTTDLKYIYVLINSDKYKYEFKKTDNNEYIYIKCGDINKYYTLYTIVFNAYHQNIEINDYLPFPIINTIFNSGLNEDIKQNLIKNLYFGNIDNFGFYIDKNKTNGTNINTDDYAVYYLDNNIKHFPNINGNTYKLTENKLFFQNINNSKDYLIDGIYFITNNKQRKYILTDKGFLFYTEKPGNFPYSIFIENENIHKFDVDIEPFKSITKTIINFSTQKDINGFFLNNDGFLIIYPEKPYHHFYNENGNFYKIFKNFDDIIIYENIFDVNDKIPMIYENLDLLISANDGSIPNNIIFKSGNYYHIYINGIEHIYDELTNKWSVFSASTPQITTPVYQPPQQLYPIRPINVYYNGSWRQNGESFIRNTVYFDNIQNILYYIDQHNHINYYNSGGDKDENERIFKMILVYIFNKLIMSDIVKIKNFFEDFKKVLN